MELEELREIFVMLAEKGLNPQLCDTPVPYYDTAVMCGKPKMVVEGWPENYMFPKELLSLNPEVMVRAQGDSLWQQCCI